MQSETIQFTNEHASVTLFIPKGSLLCNDAVFSRLPKTLISSNYIIGQIENFVYQMEALAFTILQAVSDGIEFCLFEPTFH